MSASKNIGRLEPVALLFAAGLCIGSIFPLGKLATALGVPPLAYVGVTALEATLVLALASLVAGQSLRPDAKTVRYALVAGQLTFAIPWTAVVWVIPHLGSGLPAIVQSTAPIFTLILVYGLRMERPVAGRLAGLALGLAGTLVILLSRPLGPVQQAPPYWYAAAFIAPVVLAGGNVFRTVNWPAGQRPLPLAAWSLLAAALGVGLAFAALVGLGVMDWPRAAPGAAIIMLCQGVATGLGYALFFRLQQVGGPVFVSQLSYVNTAVGLGFAVVLFSERLTSWSWLALALIIIGVLLVNQTIGRAAARGD
jgi:drug/metabolite transporter (DMT)-like permease